MTVLPLLLLLANSIRPQTAEVPYRQPQLAEGRGQVAMTFGTSTAIYFSASPDNGRTFVPPVMVAQVGALALGRHRGPRLTILKDSLLITAIVADKVSANAHAHGLPQDGNLTAWRSTDKGQTWKQLAIVNDVPGAPREGLHAIAAAPDGSLFTAWLDSRTEGMKLYGARSTDGGATWSKNVEIYASPDGTICSCCHPSLAIDANGLIRVMWRNVLDGYRDLYLLESKDGVHFSTAKKQGEGTWKINACPMDGGGFVLDGTRVVSAWRRESNIFLAEPNQPEQDLGPGKDVAITRTKRGNYLAWTRETAIVALTPGHREPETLGANGGFVTLLPLPDGSVLAAWESQGNIETRRLD